MTTFNIQPVNTVLFEDIQQKINLKTKPLGSLGQLERIAAQIALIQQTLTPELQKPHMLVYAADHGITNSGVSAFPQEVTFQMVMNFLSGGAAINVFCKQHGIEMCIADAGVNHDFPKGTPLLDLKVAKGTANFLHEAAMSEEQLQEAIEKGADQVTKAHQEGCNVVGFGEMGIGNTSAASMLMALLCKLPVAGCVGRGTGIDDPQFANKINILEQAKDFHKLSGEDPWKVLQTFGGLEIAMICGGMLKAAELGMVILVDGFISTSAFLVGYKLYPALKDYAVFCHQSDESGHRRMLEHIGAEPILNLGMRLGEGSGAAVAYPIIQSAISFLNEMASFESAGVSNKE
ncbi:nicotinate-nucleotide--dimethylbenzimidazole phosphoribosyltransferase [Limibacter armeniacum]|uniref:nicotinate-nucleotide--dimethylbenzimidazole phosphoribosyltransferase n=1 Tax=Limibacter armeniacum TaxID=466084 RepID=UPI002FE59FF2